MTISIPRFSRNWTDRMTYYLSGLELDAELDTTDARAFVWGLCQSLGHWSKLDQVACVLDRLCHDGSLEELFADECHAALEEIEAEAWTVKLAVSELNKRGLTVSTEIS